MQRKLFFILAMVLTAMMTMAAPARRDVWRNLRLSDGTTVRAQLCGDEHLHYWKDSSGTVYCEDYTNNCYRRADLSLLVESAKARRQSAQKVQLARGKASRRASVYNGSRQGLIILAEFANAKFMEGHNKALYEQIANTRGFTNDMGFRGSVRDYFLDQSKGQFELCFDVVGPIALEHTYSYYGRNNYNGVDMRPGEMIVEAVKAVKDSVDFSRYDRDGDGEVEQVFVLYAGEGESSGFDPDRVWPHMWTLTETRGKALSVGDYTVDTYACSSELSWDDQIDGIGTFCHEFSHCLGLPDLYDTENNSTFGMQEWSLMHLGCYNDWGFVPCGLTSYERMACGWHTPIELTTTTMVDKMGALEDGGASYMIRNPNWSDEYYLLENRQLVGWDSGLPGHGLLVLHIDYDALAWVDNTVNNDSLHQRYTIFHADNDDDIFYSSVTNDPYPYMGNDSLTAFSRPAATFYNALGDGSYRMKGGIYDITEHSDGTMSFRYVSGDEASSVSFVHDDAEEDTPWYSIDGRPVGNKVEALPRGVYICRGKKHVVP